MEDKLIKGTVILASGVITMKAVKAVSYYKLHKEIEEQAKDEKQFAKKTISFMRKKLIFRRYLS